jgi:hypothetical protein
MGDFADDSKAMLVRRALPRDDAEHLAKMGHLQGA